MSLRSSAGAVVIATLACLGGCNVITGAADLMLEGPRSIDDAPPTSNGTTPDSASGDAGRGTSDLPDSGIVAVVAPDGLDFGDNACGNSPPPRRVEIHNQGAAEITFDAALADGSFFSVLPPNGSIAVGGLGVLTVSTPGVPSAGPVGVRSDALTVTTNAAGDAPHVFDVKLAAPGAIFALSTTSINFGQLQSLPVSKKITIRNDGDITGTLAYEFTTNTLNSFGVSPASPLVIAPGEVATMTVTAHPPKSGSGLRTGTLSLSSPSILCGSLPSAIELSCSRQN